MIGRVDGQVVLVAGAIPGERVVAEVTGLAKGVAFADTRRVAVASPDRQPAFTDPACGGTAFAHIAYPRQLALKAEIIADALTRLGRLAPPAPVRVAGSRTDGYRMRARVHRVGPRIGFFREGSHQLCDARATGQLLDATCEVLDAVGGRLDELRAAGVHELDVSEDIGGTSRAIHLDSGAALPWPDLRQLEQIPGISGLMATAPPRPGQRPVTRLVAGDPYVTDVMNLAGRQVSFRRHVQAFFQGNRYLLRALVTHVLEQVGPAARVVDLYAGVGLFAVSVAVTQPRAVVTAVEGDRFAARDLAVNASASSESASHVHVVHRAVERYLESSPPAADVVILDPPRTGLSPTALQGLLAFRASRVVYVSCDVATLARDVRRLSEAGYRLDQVDGFDMFPNTAHVETVVTLTR